MAKIINSAYRVKVRPAGEASDLTHLFSRLNVRVSPKKRKLSQPEGPEGRLKLMRKVVTGLIKHERLEVGYFKGDEARGYAERLISEAIRFGDLHKPTMDLAKFWITDEAAIPKLFKVLAPRYRQWPMGLPYTRILRAPSEYIGIEERLNKAFMMAVLELRGNPYPPLPGPLAKPHPGAIHNVLLEEARKEYFRSHSQAERRAEEQTNSIPVPGEESVLVGNEEEDDDPDPCQKGTVQEEQPPSKT